MNPRWRLALMLVATGCLLFDSPSGATDKKAKEPEKKKPQPAKDIVVHGELINVDLKDKVITQSFCKTFTYKMEKDKSYQIELNSPAFRAYLRLEDSEGRQLGADFDRFGNQSAVLVHRATKTGDHEIIATALNGGGTGKFTLTVKELTGELGKPIDLKKEKGGATYTGNLARTDLKYNGKIHKLFIFEMEGGKTYQIDHMSKAFDAYLYLQGPDGAVLAQDDDGGEGLNSRIVHKAAKTGKYRMVATSLGGSSTGQFTFSIRQTDPAPDDKKK